MLTSKGDADNDILATATTWTTLDCLKVYYRGQEVKLIGISGKIASGKTTLAQYLCNRGPQFKIRSFADKLREVVSVLINVPVEKTRSVIDKEVLIESLQMTVGQLLQRVGTEVGRQIHPDIWVISLLQHFRLSSDSSEYDGCCYWIIDDVRFINEAEAIKKLGGLLIRLEGDPGSCYETLMQTRDRTHLSETSLDQYEHFDCVINTNEFIGRKEALFDTIFGSDEH